MNRLLRPLDVLFPQLLRLLAPFLNVRMFPFKRIGHVKILLRQPFAFRDRVRDQSAVRLPEIDLIDKHPIVNDEVGPQHMKNKT